MFSNFKVALSSFIVLVVLNFLTIGYLYSRNTLPNWLSFSSPPIMAPDSTINLPISADNPEINQLAVGYIFKSKITQIIDTPEVNGIPSDQGPFRQIIPDISPKDDLPPFYVTSRTKVYLNKNGVNTAIRPTELKEGQLAALHVWYEVNQVKRWILKEVYIFE